MGRSWNVEWIYVTLVVCLVESCRGQLTIGGDPSGAELVRDTYILVWNAEPGELFAVDIYDSLKCLSIDLYYNDTLASETWPSYKKYSNLLQERLVILPPNDTKIFLFLKLLSQYPCNYSIQATPARFDKDSKIPIHAVVESDQSCYQFMHIPSNASLNVLEIKTTQVQCKVDIYANFGDSYASSLNSQFGPNNFDISNDSLHMIAILQNTDLAKYLNLGFQIYTKNCPFNISVYNTDLRHLNYLSSKDKIPLHDLNPMEYDIYVLPDNLLAVNFKLINVSGIYKVIVSSSRFPTIYSTNVLYEGTTTPGHDMHVNKEIHYSQDQNVYVGIYNLGNKTSSYAIELGLIDGPLAAWQWATIGGGVTIGMIVILIGAWAIYKLRFNKKTRDGYEGINK